MIRLTLRDERTLVNESGSVEGTSGDVDITGGDVQAAVLREDLLGLLLDRLRDSHRGGLRGWTTRSVRIKDFYQRWETKGPPIVKNQDLPRAATGAMMSEMRKGMAVAMGAAATRATMTPVTFIFAVLVFSFFSWEVFLVKRK
jgi:hypothetical protein